MTWAADYADVAPLRDAFIASGLTACELARYMDMYRFRAGSRIRVPDQSRVLRYLGIREYSPGHGYPNRMRERVTYGLAVQLADAIGVDPYEVGL